MFQKPEQKVRAALSKVAGPAGRDIVTSGLLSHVSVEKRQARVILELPQGASPAPDLEDRVRAAALGVSGIDAASVIVTRHADGPEPGAPAPRGVRVRSDQTPAPTHAPRAASALALPGVRAIIAVASGKGGVGKSTVAVNLALALAAEGKAVGLLDADVYGPSVPRMLGIDTRPEGGDSAKLKPVMAFGLKVMSIGLLVDADTPMIWRGPMVMSAISQMLGDVDWGDLDCLVVDMPPGTGDAQLTMAQRVPLAGAVIVSTPQEIALIDARKGIAMFEKTHVPLLGVVENMAYFAAPDGTRHHLFGEGGARRLAEARGCPFLGEVPLLERVREGGDTGTPVVATAPDGPDAAPFRAIARGVLGELERAGKPAPRILFAD